MLRAPAGLTHPRTLRGSPAGASGHEARPHAASVARSRVMGPRWPCRSPLWFASFGAHLEPRTAGADGASHHLAVRMHSWRSRPPGEWTILADGTVLALPIDERPLRPEHPSDRSEGRLDDPLCLVIVSGHCSPSGVELARVPSTRPSFGAFASPRPGFEGAPHSSPDAPRLLAQDRTASWYQPGSSVSGLPDPSATSSPSWRATSARLASSPMPSLRSCSPSMDRRTSGMKPAAHSTAPPSAAKSCVNEPVLS